MAWFRAGGGNGIPTQLKDNMDAVLNKKFGTSATYPPGEWPDDVNLLGLLEEKTTTKSAIAHIDDGADRVPVKNWQVTLGASLDGVSSLGCTQTGRNVRQNVTDYLSVNHVFFQYRNYYAGQATGYPILEGTFKAGTYTLSFNTTESIEASRVRVWAKKKSDQNWYNLSANGDLVTPTSSGYSFCSESLGHVTGTFTINEECAALGFGYYQYGTSIPYTDLMLEVGSTASDYTPYTAPTTHTVNLGRTIYGGTVDVVKGTGTDENGNDFTFTPITPTPETALGVNNFWADEGDSQVTYRSSGTETVIPPDLTTKSITENGTYNASSDNADGYSQVTVNVPTTPIISETDWNNLTDAQKRTYGLVIIQQANSGYKRGLYVNGSDYPVLEEYSDVLTTGLSLDVLVNTTYTIECCFYALGYVNDGHVMGTTTGNHRNFHLTTYNNMWYFEGDVGKSDNQLYPVAGGMDITFRQEGDTAYMNGNSVGSIGLVDGGTSYALAQRGSAMTGNNYKYKYVKIWDANDNLIHDFRFMANKTMIDLVTLNTKTYT